MTPIRCGLVGYGMIGTEHAAILRSLPDAELVVIVDSDPTKSTAIPEGAAFEADLASTLADHELDALFVCTPQHIHQDAVIPALEAGLAVFCEKPFAATVADADRMIAAAAGRGPLAIGHTLRFHPDFLAVKQAVDAGDIGQPVQIAARWNAPDYEGRIISGRTTVPLEMCIHNLDLMRWIAGDIESVYGEASSIAVTGPGPDVVVGTVRFASGAVGALDHSWIMAAESGLASDHRLAIYGTEGSAFVESRETPATIFTKNGPRFVNSMYRSDAHGIPFGALAAEDSCFLRMVRDGIPWPLTLADARAALAAAVALDLSIAEGRPVGLDEIG